MSREQPDERPEDVNHEDSKTVPAEHAVLSDEELSSLAEGGPGLGLGPQWRGLETILCKSVSFRRRRKKDGE